MQNQKLQKIILDNHSYKFAEEQIQKGKYSSLNDVIIASLKLLEDTSKNQNKLEALREAIEEGENSGEATPLTNEDFENIKKECSKEAGLIG